jgi:hypothetical protein
VYIRTVGIVCSRRAGVGIFVTVGKHLADTKLDGASRGLRPRASWLLGIECEGTLLSGMFASLGNHS